MSVHGGTRPPMLTPRMVMIAGVLVLPALWLAVAEDAISLSTLLWRYVVVLGACVGVGLVAELVRATVWESSDKDSEDSTTGSLADTGGDPESTP